MFDFILGKDIVLFTFDSPVMEIDLGYVRNQYIILSLLTQVYSYEFSFRLPPPATMVKVSFGGGFKLRTRIYCSLSSPIVILF